MPSTESGSAYMGSQHTTKLSCLSQVQSAPRISIKGRWKKKPIEVSPGPGAYTPQVISSQNPVSILGRPKHRNTIQGPGPGSYDRGMEREDFGPKYSFGSQARLKESKYTRSPGPGSYTIKDNEKGKSITLQGRWKSTGNLRDGLTPGPGTYVPSVASGVVFERGPKFSFGTGARPRDHSLSCPGPGQYIVNTGFKPEGPKYSMKARDLKRSRPSLEPGPGSFGGITSFG